MNDISVCIGQDLCYRMKGSHQILNKKIDGWVINLGTPLSVRVFKLFQTWATELEKFTNNHHQRAIVRELKRNTQQTYRAEQRRLVYHRKELKSEQLIQTLQHYLKLNGSPE